MVLEKLNRHEPKKKKKKKKRKKEKNKNLDTDLALYTKFNSKCITGLNVK